MNGMRFFNDFFLDCECLYDIDVFVLAEYVAAENELSRLLDDFNRNLLPCFTVGCERINIWSSYVNIKPGVQNHYYSTQIINNKYVLCGVHLMSDLHGYKGMERYAVIRELMKDIKRMKMDLKSEKVIIIGDFNEMPYSKGCLNADGLHGLPALDNNTKQKRTVDGIEYAKFYNPMWNLFGDYSYPPGTYYRNQADLYSPMWHILDQVVISMDVVPLFVKESLKIVTYCDGVTLADKNNHPNKDISDHFPIVCEIRE